MRKILLLLCGLLLTITAGAQRWMENLNRGLVAVKTTSGVFVSWRISGSEYYDTQYNLYRDGTKVNATPLNVSNFTDAGGTMASTYTVRAVVRGTEQAASPASTVWGTQYLSVPMGHVFARNGKDVTSQYELNDISAADLDGDGEYELIVKRINNQDGLFPVDNDSAYCIFEAYKLNGTKLWTIDCGPNLISGGHVETNVVAYDWDMDGKAELIMRAADGTILGDGTVCGSATANYRDQMSHSANMTYATAGAEYLVYMDGMTAKPYDGFPMTYPLKRFESGETDLSKAWGDGYGHRSNKFFFGAPYLDGRKPSIFLARGIYTRHKMIAYDVNPATHQLTTRWTWTNNQGGSPWYGQGYHNYGIADVDLDGRDEIVYGSMVIDDNGKGLSTTGLGHGDAQHTGDLDPYRKGLEIYTCNEDRPGSTYRDGTTAKIYYRYATGSDVGRAMAANVTDQYLGSQMIDARSGLVVSSVTDKAVQTGWTGMTMNYNIYWDGDLCQETFDYQSCSNNLGVNGTVYKFGVGAYFTANGTYTNNGTKGTPCLQGDILGDWREEMVMRSTDNMSLRIYTTTDETPWRNYTLLHDMQYRQAICWQMCGYNQPPHTSYFLGKAEGITIAPPPVMTNGRTEIDNTITAANNGQHILLCNTAGGMVTVTDGASPYITTVNVPSHTEGSAPSECTTQETAINTTYSTYTLTGGAFAGAMRLVKQGEGILTFSGNQAYTGSTDLWGGTTNFTGTLPNSSVSMKRFAELNADGTFGKGISMEYGAILRPAGADTKGTITVDSLTMDFGAIVEFDVYSDGNTSDQIKINKKLTLKELDLDNGPEYSDPIFRFVQHKATGEATLAPGKYLLMEASSIDGDVDDVVIEGLGGIKKYLSVEGNKIYLNVEGLREATDITWIGSVDENWDLAETSNFKNAANAPEIFVTGDNVTINDEAVQTNIDIEEDLQPASINVDGTKNIVIAGDGSLSGAATITKAGTGTLTLNGVNAYTGGTVVNGGTLKVNSLPNAQTENSSIGAYKTGVVLQLNNSATLTPTIATKMGSNIKLGTASGDGGTISNSVQLTVDGILTGYNLTKEGSGTLILNGKNTHKKTIISTGTISMGEVDNQTYLGDTVVFNGTNSTLQIPDNSYSYSTAVWNISVPKGKKGTINADRRCNFTGKLVGEGTLTVYAPSSGCPRCWFSGDWSKFEGTLIPTTDGGDFQLSNNYGMAKGKMQIASGVNVVAQKQNSSATNYSYAIGEVTGTGSLGAATAWTVGDAGDFTFDGKITAGKFTKAGTGEMKVTNYSTPSSAAVSAGTLCLNKSGATSGLMGTGTMTVAANGTLAGTGMISNSTTTVNGTLRPGVTETSLTGTLDFDSKNVNMKSGSTLACFIASKSMYTKLANINTMTMNGATIKIALRASYAPSAGDTFQLWDATTNTVDASTLKFELQAPGNGYMWDTSEIGSGILKIATDTGIAGVSDSEELDCTAISLDGAAAARFTSTYKDIQNALDASNIANGIYLVKMKSAKGMSTKKYIKN